MHRTLNQDLAIDVDNVSKRFTLGSGAEYSRLTEVVSLQTKRWLQRLFRPGSSIPVMKPVQPDDRFEGDCFWALRNVSFQVNKGEIVGIIGHNGAGKSTLLKILSRIVTPSQGRVGVRGRVGSLLEVGTGFHPELTGRENIYLNGAILGLKRSEIRRRFDEIVEFAEVSRFLDTPVKRYSSGMTVRLGFSVAAHLEPDVLIIDEVLSVGDQGFQKKCLGKATELGTQGRTVLLVSHNLASIATMCSRALYLERGRLAADDRPATVIESYLAQISPMDGKRTWSSESAPKSDHVCLKSVSIRGARADDDSDQVEIDGEICVVIDYEVLQPKTYNAVQIHLKDDSGVFILASANAHSMNTDRDPTFGAELAPGHYRCECRIPPNFLNDSRYFVSVLMGPEIGKPTVICEGVIAFTVHDTGAMRKEFLGSWSGPVIRPRLGWSTLRLP